MCSAGGRGEGDGQMEPLQMLGVMSSAGKATDGEDCFQAFMFLFFSFFLLLFSGYVVDLGIKLHVSIVAPQCWEPVLPGPV